MRMVHSLQMPTVCLLCASSVSAFAQGDPARGEQLYQSRCGACHSVDDNGAGPRHRGVVGRKAATQPGFDFMTKRSLSLQQRGADSYVSDQSGRIPQRVRFLALCQSLRPDLLRYVYWLSRDRDLAEDVVQETLLRAWKAQDTLLDEAAAKTWFLTIARREYARCFQRKRLMMVDVDELIAQEEPMLAAARDQDLAEIREALFKVPQKYREPLVLQALMGFSTSEIAAELELSRAAVLMRLFRGRNLLRALCGEERESEPEE